MIVTIYKRDPKTAEPIRMGSVRFDGMNVQFPGLDKDMAGFLQRITVEGKTFTPLDGVKYMRALPFFLRGGYMWATRPRSS
jgi:hypothetical protein